MVQGFDHAQYVFIPSFAFECLWEAPPPRNQFQESMFVWLTSCSGSGLWEPRVATGS